MNIFPDTPQITDPSRIGLSFGNSRDARSGILEILDSPSVRTRMRLLKLAVLVELERGSRARGDILDRLVSALQKVERAEIMRKICEQRARKSRP